MVDTGTSPTVTDLTTLLVNGYFLVRRKRATSAHVFKIKSLESLGIKHNNFEICSYDFLNEYDGVLGIDFIKSELTISQPKLLR